ncbi:MAG: glutamate mutase L [Candidatus Coatesbacteria bacterium]|nr:glutamate mutase L [Candidatus Coatesbacteria bacterium]
MAKDIEIILATDCGSTTTKSILIMKKEGKYRLIRRGEAPTTVEAPVEDVTRGVINAIEELEELTGLKLLKDGKIQTPIVDGVGADLYISTSSAGGGLQMMVAGVVRSMTAESAQRAALGAGAIVMDVLATNDKRLPHQQIERIRHLRPDMILLSGGIDGGTTKHVITLAEIIKAADPKPRLGKSYNLPVIYAGNNMAITNVKELLENVCSLLVVENIRPVLEKENLGPAREEIHKLFMEHVMAQAPGYDKLMDWTDAPIMPTPGAVGFIIELIAEQQQIEVVGVDIGGATTDIFSVFVDHDDKIEGTDQGKRKFNRTVSANLGMSYSISNVLAEAGLENIMRWVPFNFDESDIRNRIKNKMIRPTTIPQLMEELIVEQAIAKEALRLAFNHHRSFAVGLKGVQKERTISDAFDQTSSGATLVNMMNLDLLVGSGGVLSHAPRRHQSAMMMIDAFMPEGFTKLAVDSIFMMPQLGVLASIENEDIKHDCHKAAMEVFEMDCLIHLGTCICLSGSTKKEGAEVAKFTIDFKSGRQVIDLLYGQMKLLPLNLGETATVLVEPTSKFDVGAGFGKPITKEVTGGVVGLILDGRGRIRNTDGTSYVPIPTDPAVRVKKLKEWMLELKAYPERVFR